MPVSSSLLLLTILLAFHDIFHTSALKVSYDSVVCYFFFSILVIIPDTVIEQPLEEDSATAVITEHKVEENKIE